MGRDGWPLFCPDADAHRNIGRPDEVAALLPRITQQTLVPALFFDDIVSDASDWKNEAMAAHYGKRMVVPEPVP